MKGGNTDAVGRTENWVMDMLSIPRGRRIVHFIHSSEAWGPPSSSRSIVVKPKQIVYAIEKEEFGKPEPDFADVPDIDTCVRGKDSRRRDTPGRVLLILSVGLSADADGDKDGMLSA